jgi:hypothetical protein
MFDLFFISPYIYTARGPKDFEEKKIRTVLSTFTWQGKNPDTFSLLKKLLSTDFISFRFGSAQNTKFKYGLLPASAIFNRTTQC